MSNVFNRVLWSDSAISIRTASRSRENSHEASDLLTYLDDGERPFTLFLSISPFSLPPSRPCIFPSSVSRCSYRAGDFSSIGQLPNDNHTKEYCSRTRNACVCFVYSTGVNRQCLWFPARAIPGVIQMARYGSIRNRITAWISRDKRADREREETVAIFMNGTLRRWNNVKMRRKRIPCNFQNRTESCSQLDKGDIFDNKARWKIELSSAIRYQLFSCREQFKIIAFFPICYSDGEKWFYAEKIYQHNYYSSETFYKLFLH